jgi:hypothetical protein
MASSFVAAAGNPAMKGSQNQPKLTVEKLGKTDPRQHNFGPSRSPHGNDRYTNANSYYGLERPSATPVVLMLVEQLPDAYLPDAFRQS